MPTLEAAPAPSTIASKVELTRVIAGPRDRVYRMWTDSELLKQWFGPANMHCTSASLDARAGGAYSIAVRPEGAPATQPDSIATGSYTSVVPGELLQFTWKPTWRPGEESLVTVSFKETSGGGTEVAIRHEEFAPEAIEGYTSGWTACFDKLEAAIDTDYARHFQIKASVARVFAALTTSEGISGWWTPASGSGQTGDDLNIYFSQEEPFVFHVDRAAAGSVQWTCGLHAAAPEWYGTKILFDLVEKAPDACELHFRHSGLTPQLFCYKQCEAGWNRYLPSLVAYAETGQGMPRKNAPAV